MSLSQHSYGFIFLLPVSRCMYLSELVFSHSPGRKGEPHTQKNASCTVCKTIRYTNLLDVLITCGVTQQPLSWVVVINGAPYQTICIVTGRMSASVLPSVSSAGLLLSSIIIIPFFLSATRSTVCRRSGANV